MDLLNTKAIRFTIMRALTLFVQIFYILYTTRVLIPADYGKFSSYVSLIVIYSIVYEFGYSWIIYRYTIDFKLKYNSAYLLLQKYVRKYLVLAPLIIGSFTLYMFILGFDIPSILSLSTISFFSLIYCLFFNFFYSLGRVLIYASKELLIFSLRIAFLTAFLFNGFQFAPLLTVVLSEGCVFCVILCIIVKDRKSMNFRGETGDPSASMDQKKLHHFGIYSYSSNILFNLIWAIPFSMITILHFDLGDIGFFNLAVQVFLIALPQVLASFFSAVNPDLYTMYAQDRTKFKEILDKYMLIPVVFMYFLAGALMFNSNLMFSILWPSFLGYAIYIIYFSAISIFYIVMLLYLMYFQIIENPKYAVLILSIHLISFLVAMPILLIANFPRTLETILSLMLMTSIIMFVSLVSIARKKGFYFNHRGIMASFCIGFLPFFLLSCFALSDALRICFTCVYLVVYFYLLKKMRIFNIMEFISLKLLKKNV